MSRPQDVFGQPLGIILGDTTFRGSELVLVGSPEVTVDGNYRLEVLLISGPVSMEFKHEHGARWFGAILRAMQSIHIDQEGGELCR